MDIKVTSNFHFYKPYGCEGPYSQVVGEAVQSAYLEKKLCGCRGG